MATHLKTVKAKRGTSHVPDVFRPSIHLDEKQLKEIKNWKVGGKYTLILEVEQTSMNNDNPDKRINASFDIMKIGTPNKGFNHKMMKEFQAGKLMDGKRHVNNISEAMKMASG